MKSIGAAAFKDGCLAILDQLGPEGVLITKRGRPVARLLPVRQEPSALIGSLAGHLEIRGEVLETGAEWAASVDDQP